MSRLHELYHHRDRPDITLRHLAEFLLFTHEETMQQLDDLKAAVQAEDNVIQSAVTLIQGIAQRIADAGVDAQALQDLTADINSQAQALAAAVQANTPVSGS